MSDYLPPGVVTEILKRLPVKSLLRFRCVCTDWCSLISNPNFTNQHLSHSSSSPTLPMLVRHYSKLHSKEIYTIFNDESFDLETSTRISFPFHEKSEFYFHIVGFCNGLLCLSDDLFGYRETIIIWNPSIKRAITLPTPRVIFDRCGPHMFALGFGFDSENNDYKVVRVAYLLPNRQCWPKIPPTVEVFSISLGVWRRVKNNIESLVTEQFWSQAVVCGTVHWVAYKPTNNYIDDKDFCNLLLKFDLHTEKFSEMSLPDDLVCDPPISITATLVKGYLSILYTNNFLTKVPPSSCGIWIMKEYGNVESWTPVLYVTLEMGLWRMLGVKENREILISKGSGELVSYNLENKTENDTGICGTKNSFYVDKYVESLF